MLDTSPIIQIINGEVEDSIKLLQRKIATATNFMLRNDAPENSIYKKDIADLMSILLYLKESDNTLLGLWKKRTTQVRGYTTSLQFVDDKNKNNNPALLNKIALHLSTLIANVPNISAFGDILFYVDVVKKKIKNIDDTEDIESEIIVRWVNPIFYVRNKTDDSFSFNDNTDWTNNYDTDKSKYIYIKDELFFIGGTMRALAVYSLAKQSNLNSWFNGNNRLFSAIIASYDTEKLLNFFVQSNIENMEKNKQFNMHEFVNTAFEAMNKLSQFGRAVVPDAIKFEEKRLVDSNIGASYEKFIDKIDEMFEIAILGQSGTTRTSDTGSYAKAKTMNLTTEDIKWTDVNYAKELVNKYISKVLPQLTSSVKPEDIEFSFVFDDTDDVVAYSELLRTISSIPIKTLESHKGFAVPVLEVFKGLGMTASPDYYDANEIFVLGDGDSSFFANEINNNIEDVVETDGVE